MECASTCICVVISTGCVLVSVFIDITGLLEVVSVCPPTFFTAGVGTISVWRSPDHGTIFARIGVFGVLPLLFTGVRLFGIAALVTVGGTLAKWGDSELYVVWSAIIVLSLCAVEAEGLRLVPHILENCFFWVFAQVLTVT